MKVNEIEKLKKIYTKVKSKNKTLYACVLPDNNIGMVKCNNCFGSSLFPYDPHGTFNGSIDQLRIFDYSLTSLQVAQLYNEIYSP